MQKFKQTCGELSLTMWNSISTFSFLCKENWFPLIEFKVRIDMHLNCTWNKCMLILVESILYTFVPYEIVLGKKMFSSFKNMLT